MVSLVSYVKQIFNQNHSVPVLINVGRSTASKGIIKKAKEVLFQMVKVFKDVFDFNQNVMVNVSVQVKVEIDVQDDVVLKIVT